MKRKKLRTWVKVTIGLVSLTVLSAAASCSNTALHAGAVPPDTMTNTVPGEPLLPLKQADEAEEKHRNRASVMEEADTLYVPRLVKEVVNI